MSFKRDNSQILRYIYKPYIFLFKKYIFTGYGLLNNQSALLLLIVPQEGTAATEIQYDCITANPVLFLVWSEDMVMPIKSLTVKL